MTTNAIHSVLAMMKVTAQKAAGNVVTLSAPTTAGAGFISELNSSIKQINGMQVNAQRKAEKFELGMPGIALNDVIVEMQKASLALHFGIQINNKLINAYQEVMNMAV
ncbi:flagellar hook-basal body protein FliE [Sodalis-like endosymbiont of Proechinophthirus fluctus]|uniref:flagellar hook-basal body complex protein FliE n=1 Tax=Sodalis-like endosymbiont of Proechinophthirus fluctus TaxID=1462730 RepID=UPI0007A896F6|nr:flagellar hook-basal body complex protein FliE [Sodalis-like endosymbiont of Proechinophthirus fluctus]KYP96948.1 flagellar hook-basal body protein FliE [Sodalis-like endosymbiont of Proechinophthirus fluctus]